MSRSIGLKAPLVGAALLTFVHGVAFGQAASPSADAPRQAVPTTKVLAIGHMTPNATPEAMRAVMSQEVNDTVRLYLAGKIDQWFFRKDQRGVVFLMNMSDTKDAKAALDALPLGKAGLMSFDFIPLGPLAPLGTLLNPSAP